MARMGNNPRWWCSSCDGELAKPPEIVGLTTAGGYILRCPVCGGVDTPDGDGKTALSEVADCTECGGMYSASLLSNGVCPDCL